MERPGLGMRSYLSNSLIFDHHKPQSFHMRILKSYSSLFIVFYFFQYCCAGYSVQSLCERLRTISVSHTFVTSMLTIFCILPLRVSAFRLQEPLNVGDVTEDMLFDGNYDQYNYQIAPGGTVVLTINLAVNGNGAIHLPGGKVIANFYGQGNPTSITGRIQKNDNTWYDITDWTNISIGNRVTMFGRAQQPETLIIVKPWK